MMSLFRELTPEEVAFVSGAYTYQGQDGVIYSGAFGTSGGWTGNPGGGGGGWGGGGGGGYDSNNVIADSPGPILGNMSSPDDAHIDCVAKGLSDQINQKADHHYMEYEGMVYVTMDGEVHASNLVSNGQSGGATSQAHSYQDFGIPDGGYVIAIVHNHPDQILQDPSTGATEPVRNPGLAAAPSFGDMQILNNLHTAYSQNSGYPFIPEDVRMYVGYNGSLNEFDWSDQDWSHLSEGNHGQALWAQKSDFKPACGS